MKNFNWGHGVALALGLFIAFILYLIFIFPNGQANSELVTERYYEDELIYQDVIDAKKNGDQLTIKPIYTQNSSGIKITFPKEIIDSKKAKFHLYRSEDSRLDVKKEVELDAENAYQIPKKVLAPGNYILKNYWTFNNKNYQIDYDLVWKQP